jgi:hypothetical protein
MSYTLVLRSQLRDPTLSLLALVPSPLLFGQSESSSSKNTMHGLLLRARVNKVPRVASECV